MSDVKCHIISPSCSICSSSNGLGGMQKLLRWVQVLLYPHTQNMKRKLSSILLETLEKIYLNQELKGAKNRPLLWSSIITSFRVNIHKQKLNRFPSSFIHT